MKNFYILLARAAFSLILASLISMFFFDGIHPFKTPALAAGLLFFAYIFEHSRKKD